MKVLLLTDWEYGHTHRLLAEVYGKRIGDEHDLVWVMRPPEDRETVGTTTWHGSPVYVLNTKSYDNVTTFRRRLSGSIDSHPVVDIYETHGPFDVIHVRNDYAMGLLASRLAARDPNTAYVHQISHLKAEARQYRAKRRYASPHQYLIGASARVLRARFNRNATMTFVISDAMKTHLKDRGYDAPIHPLPTGADVTLDPSSIDPNRFTEAYSIDDDDHTLLYLGDMSPVRELEFLLDVQARLDPQVDCTLVMVGGREDDHVDRLREAARRRSVEESVVFTGWLSDEELINSAIRAADVGLSPIPTTAWFYNYSAPIKVLEYLAMETPVVGTDTPDQQTVLSESGGGRSVPYDPDRFAQAVAELLEKPAAERESMGARGREYIARERSFDVLAERTLELYGEAMRRVQS